MKIIESTQEVQVGDVQASTLSGAADAPEYRAEVIAADDATITLRIEIARRTAYQAPQYRNQSYKRTSKLAAPYEFPGGSRRWYERSDG